MVTLAFHDDPRAFLAAAGSYLADRPVLSTLVATVAERSVEEDAAGVAHGLPHRWWVVATDDPGQVVGVAMRTAPFEPYPAYLLPMPVEAAVTLARVVHERGERVPGANGALPATEVFASETARLGGGTARLHVRTRLHELLSLVPPTRVPGRLRAATPGEVGLAAEWFRAFALDADEQAGRDRGSHRGHAHLEQFVARRIEDRQVWWWEDHDGVPVHLSGTNPPVYGTVRVGPVYTPPEHRGRGYAANAVAELSRMVLAGGRRPCLFTDQANAVSNRLYAALGYRPVADMAEYLVA